MRATPDNARDARAAHRAASTACPPARGSRLGGERRAAVASRPGPPLASLAPAPRLLIAPRLITNRELLLCVLRARFV
ncbi:conserved hypothetical protein [Burkholderia pseudomallei 668]|nr:conserved hypothetical protein [Burkholderia pseudomallei 668]